MKTSILIILTILFLLSNMTYAQSGGVEVKVSGASNSKGEIIIGLYNKEDGFPGYDKSYKGASVKASSTAISYTFNNLPDGTYAIAVWHDENGNKELDKNFFGVPKEKYGFSNNKFGTMGPPTFNDTSFRIVNGKQVDLEIIMK